MVPLGLGQAILGGDGDGDYHTEIYHLTCSQQICQILLLNQELSFPREYFVAIPIPDAISGCISESKVLYFLTQETIALYSDNFEL